MNPKAYCTMHEIPTSQFIKKAREVAPKYNKVAHSMASNPGYGLKLDSRVSRHICDKSACRTKQSKGTFRLTEVGRGEFNSAKQALGHTTDQSAIEYAIQLYIEKAATTAGTVSDCKTNISIDNTIPKSEGCQDVR